MSFATMSFETKDGPMVLHFNFVPPEPTIAQREALVPHICDTCEWKNARHTGYCGSPALPAGDHCSTWVIDLDAFSNARVEYYKNLHKKCYG